MIIFIFVEISFLFDLVSCFSWFIEVVHASLFPVVGVDKTRWRWMATMEWLRFLMFWSFYILRLSTYFYINNKLWMTWRLTALIQSWTCVEFPKECLVAMCNDVLYIILIVYSVWLDYRILHSCIVRYFLCYYVMTGTYFL